MVAIILLKCYPLNLSAIQCRLLVSISGITVDLISPNIRYRLIESDP